MRVMGVDPGTRRTGYGVIDKEGSALTLVVCGAVSANARAALPQRLKTIYDGLAQVLTEQRPDVLAVEDPFFGKSVSSAIRIGEARALAILCAANAGIPVFEYSPALVKKASVGSGVAHKSQVQAMVQRILALPAPPEPEDAADALAIAICHCHRADFGKWGNGVME